MREVSDKVIYPDLSYKIIGVAFKVFNDVGYGMSEKYYQRVFAKALEQENIRYEKEKNIKFFYNGQEAGAIFLIS